MAKKFEHWKKDYTLEFVDSDDTNQQLYRVVIHCWNEAVKHKHKASIHLFRKILRHIQEHGYIKDKHIRNLPIYMKQLNDFICYLRNK